MKRAILAMALLLPTAAAAQQPGQQPLPPQVQALQQTVVELTGQKLDWQAHAIELQRQVDELTKQLEAAKKPSPETKEPSK